jgi:hypothetical protein
MDGKRQLLLLTAAALVVRLVYLWLEPSCPYAGDEPSWIELGRQLGRPAVWFSPLRSDLLFYPPGYPYFVALVWRATGSLRGVLWVQAALGALLVPAVGRAGSLVFGRRAGLVAGAIAAFYPDFVWFAAHFWSETLFIVVAWWAIERTLQADAGGRARAAAVAGVLWGLATLTRELALYLVPIVAVWMLRPGGDAAGRALEWLRPFRARLARAAALVLACVLTVAPWTLRNALVFGSFIPVSTMGGLNLWQGNTTLTHLEIYKVLATKGGPIEQDRYCRSRAWQEIAARQPTWIVQKLASEMPEFWKAGSEVLDHLLGRQACGPLSRASLVTLELLLLVPYLVLLALFLVGLVRLRLGGGASLLLLLLAAYNAAHVVAYATPRFRLPVMPVLFLVAAALLVGRSDGSLVPLRGWRAALLVVLALAAVAVLAPGLDELV